MPKTRLASLAAKIAARIYRPRIEVRAAPGLRRMGTAYGGWTFMDADYLHGSMAISAGLGEDASFDIAFAKTYNSEVLLVDPTPRSIAHFEAIERRLGQAATAPFVAGGCQPVEAYDLSGLEAGSLRLDSRALWTHNGTVRFYEPEDARNVSHSIKFKPQDERRFVDVPSVSIADMLAGIGRPVSLLKMDIEGAESEVLSTIGSWPHHPAQLLVEFDVLRKPGRESAREVENLASLLANHGYVCRHFDGDRNYLFVRD